MPLILYISQESSTERRSFYFVQLKNPLRAVVPSKAASHCHVTAKDTRRVVSTAHPILLISTASVPSLTHPLHGVLADGVANGGDATAADSTSRALTPAQSWRAWELNMDAVRTALGGAAFAALPFPSVPLARASPFFLLCCHQTSM